MSGMKIVLADDHRVMRTGLRMLLERVPGWHVVGEAGDADSALDAVAELRPDVLVLDLIMPGRPSLEAIADVARRSPGTRVVVLTMEADPSIARRALSAGAAAYALKEAADTELVEAIRAAAAGGSYLDPSLGASIAAPPPEDDIIERLSPREREVLRLIALGHTNAAIADGLELSLRTVESHRAHIQAKTKRTTRADLVDLALKAGLLDPERRHRESIPH
jgi:two-component system response regulator NreC